MNNTIPKITTPVIPLIKAREMSALCPFRDFFRGQPYALLCGKIEEYFQQYLQKIINHPQILPKNGCSMLHYSIYNIMEGEKTSIETGNPGQTVEKRAVLKKPAFTPEEKRAIMEKTGQAKGCGR